MGAESLSTANSKPKFNSLESLKGIFKQRLETILESQLTVDNVETFADEALARTINLIGEVMSEYRKNPNVKARPTTLFERDQEDEAFKILELPNIHEVLDRINDVIGEIDNIKKEVRPNTEKSNKVITSPQKGLSFQNGDGSANFEKKTFKRLLTLLYILKHDFDIEPKDVRILEGIVTEDMMRKIPYVRVEVPTKERVVYICDEEGNASYIFDTKKLNEVGLTIDDIDLDDKTKKNSLIGTYPSIGVRVIQSPNWRSNVARALEGPIVEEEKQAEGQKVAKVRVSEFREKKVWPPFAEFKAEVMSFYHNQKDIGVWYNQERKIHPNWPANPHVTYKGQGWQSWPKLVEKYLSFEDFQEEVRRVYKESGEGNAHKWYMKEYKNHPKWPSDPYMFYSDEEWISWSDLVGQENIHSREFISFEQFQSEVRALYPGQGDVQEWYKKTRVEKGKTNTWPSIPHWLYRNSGWIGWAELVGKESHMKRKFLPFDQFQAEVRALHPKLVGLREWYREEKKKHKNWPNKPEEKYDGNGWVGWAELIGEKTPPIKEFLSFNDFRAEVKSLYPGGRGISTWYTEEQKKHPNWPVNPHTVYRDKGWVSWAEIVKE
jgi:hypothetical protein